jgi:cell division protein FtsN
MKSRSKSNNLVALLIAVILIAIGFALAFIHRQSESNEQSAKTPVTTIMNTVPDRDTSSTPA